MDDGDGNPRMSTSRMRGLRQRATPLQDTAVGIALGFVAIGALGFLPGITVHFDSIEFAGSESEAKLLGLFQVSVLHNLVHIGFGLVGAFMSWFLRGAVAFLAVGGVLYLVLGVYGLIVPDEHALNFLPVNLADDLLHLGIGAAMIIVLLAVSRVPTKLSSGVSLQAPQ